MSSSSGSNSINKPWDHAWSTEEMRKNRRDWSLAADSGLLKHLQQFSETITKKANETQNALESMTAHLNETAILVDNLTNTSLALANSQFIESRVQEDNTELEQPHKDVKPKEIDPDLSATDLLVSVCESIRQGLKIMDEKYEKVEVVASDSEDDDDDDLGLPSVILRPKDPYQDRPLPYVIGSEQWKASNKVGLESSSSESEEEEEDEEASDTDNKNITNVLSSNPRTNLGIGRMSSTSSESNDYNVESNSIKDTDKGRLYARSQDTLNSDTEPTTPSSVLPKTQHNNNGSPSFAEELAKRLGSVYPTQRNVMANDPSDQVINRSKDDIFSPERDQNVFSNKSDNLFSKGKNLFSDETSSTSWKEKPTRPVNKNIIPASIDVPPPLSDISSAPKSTIDDLFGDPEDSDDSDDIFSNKASKNIFASEREAVKTDVLNKQHLNVENVQNASHMATSTPEMNDKGKGLFEDNDDEDDDLFKSSAKTVRPPPDTSVGSAKKKPVGGVSIFGKVDILSSSKFRRQSSSSSSSDSDDNHHRQTSSSSNNPANATISAIASSKSNDGSGSASASSNNNVFSSLEAGNNAAANSRASLSNSSSNTGSSSGISAQLPNVDNTAGSSLGADFQPLMTSSRLKSEEIYRERVPSDSLFGGKTRSGNSAEHQQQQQQQRSTVEEDASEDAEVFEPPPLPKASDGSKSKSKVTSLFDDSDSGDDLFASASPGARSQRSAERTPSRVSVASTGSSSTAQPPPPRAKPQYQKRGLFDEDDEDGDDLFGSRDVPDNLFSTAPTSNLAKVTAGLFDDVPPLDDEEEDDLFGDSKTKSKKPSALFDDVKEETKPIKREPPKVQQQPPPLPVEKKTEEKKEAVVVVTEKTSKKSAGGSRGLFDDSEDSDDSDLFGKASKPPAASASVKPSVPASLFGKPDSGQDIFDSVKSRPKKLTGSIFDDSDDEGEDDLFGGKKAGAAASVVSVSSESVAKSMDENGERRGGESEEGEKKKRTVNEPAPVAATKTESKSKSIFSDEDDDDDDLFGDKKKKENNNGNDDKKEKSKENGNGSSPKPEVKAKKPEVAPKSALFAEMRQKLEKQHRSENNGSAVDGAVSSKKEPPKTLKLQKSGSPTAGSPEAEPTSSSGGAPKKPAVSSKIMNLMGNMGGLKILSPNDAPPLFRKSNSNGSNEDGTAGQETPSSEASTPSLASGASSPHTSGSKGARDSPSLRSDNTEGAISFDEPAQVETLTSIASKSRVRIPAKRRPQSRQARQSALLQSGIDFDVPDVISTSPPTDQPNGVGTNGDAGQIDPDRLQPASRTAVDNDRSEISRNTTTNLLSPSTDSEEDLFDVPPDLPEDPAAREESLFGRAPLLSPVERFERSKRKSRTPEPKKSEDVPDSGDGGEKSVKREEKRERKGDREEKKEKKEKVGAPPPPIDPLRDDSRDPLEDPSQLFAFVTKTPSPEKNKGLIPNEDDDSLFSSSSKPSSKAAEKKTKPSLFDDDDAERSLRDASGSDLFSSSGKIAKMEKKPLKTGLFDDAANDKDDDDDEDLFGSSSKKTEPIELEAEQPPPLDQKPKSASRSSTLAKDIFDDSSDEEDIFASSKKASTIPKKKVSPSLFDDEEDIFASPKPASLQDSKTKLDASRPVVKKAVTRDLKKTAEKIVEDPLSMLQDD